MSSPLDGRIRKLAREEAAALNGGQNDVVPNLQQQITDLHEHLHQAATVIQRLEHRVALLEKTPPVGEQVKMASRRGTARKETGE